jgi:hypothetical protein
MHAPFAFTKDPARPPNEVRPRPPDVLYTVTVRNDSPDVWDEVAIFYTRTNSQGAVFVRELRVVPNDVRNFMLGRCSEMQAYVVGIFIGSQLVFQFPAAGDGNITPDRASQIKPSDVAPCADSWVIGP